MRVWVMKNGILSTMAKSLKIVHAIIPGVVLLAVVCNTLAAPLYLLTDLGINMIPLGISPSGQYMVGQMKVGDSWRSVRWSNGIADDLGTLSGGGNSWLRRVNDSGVGVGTAYNSNDKRRGIYTSGSTLVDIGSWLLDGQSDIYDINSSGIIVGGAEYDAWPYGANYVGFAKAPGGPMHEVARNLHGSLTNGPTRAINDVNEVVGEYTYGSVQPWFSRASQTEGTSLVDWLGEATPVDINKLGHIVTSNPFRCLLGDIHNKTAPLVDLGTLGMSNARALNDSDQVVGWPGGTEYHNSYGWRWIARIYDKGKMYVLEDLVIDRKNLVLEFAFDINNRGQIVAQAYDTLTKERHGVLLTQIHLNGDGTAGNPYLITNKADLLALAADTGNYDKCFILTADIDLAGTTFTQAVIAADTDVATSDFQGTTFNGIFDGNGHTISNLTITDTDQDYVGLFGYTYGATIQNLGVDAVNLSTKGIYAGGLVGYKSGGTVSNCYSTGSVTSYYTAGGLVGLCNGAISNCYSKSSVTSYSYDSSAGGLVGELYDGTITNCWSEASVASYSSGNGSSVSAGGLVGYQWSNGNIANCYCKGSVVSSDNFPDAGGLVGYADGGTITNCYSSASVASSFSGSYSDSESFTAGLVGYKSGGNLSNCYSTGTVSASGDGIKNLGGLIASGSEVTNSFWDIETSGQTTSAGGTGKTTTEMKTLSTFTSAGWDFLGETTNGSADTWRMCVNGINYPKLTWQHVGAGDFACPDGVSTDDLLLLSEDWLLTYTLELYGADATGDKTVNLADFAVLAQHWLE
jgi:hypothetical protein